MDDIRMHYKNGVKANGALTCPQCGAPITDEKCEYCGVIFYDFACIECNKPFYLKIKHNDQINIFKVVMDEANVTMSEEPTLWADNAVMQVMKSQNVDIDLHFHQVY